jgi:hypothetical protein
MEYQLLKLEHPIDPMDLFDHLDMQLVKSYYNWYISKYSERLLYFISSIKKISNYDCDYSPSSLAQIWPIIIDQIRFVQISEEQLQKENSQFQAILNSVAKKFDVSYSASRNSEKLTNVKNTHLLLTVESQLYCFDVGFYFASVFLHNNPSSKWILDLQKKSPEYKKPCILVSSKFKTTFDPHCIAQSSIRRFINGDKNATLTFRYNYYQQYSLL